MVKGHSGSWRRGRRRSSPYWIFGVLLAFVGMGAEGDIAKDEASAADEASAEGEVSLPAGYWSLEESDAILARTRKVTLNPDLSALSPAEGRALESLLEAGELLNRLYERQGHHQAESSLAQLQDLHERLGAPKATQNLLDLQWLFHGPIAATIRSQRLPFLPVDREAPGRNVYPLGVKRDEIREYLEQNPEARGEILHPRTVVRRVSQQDLQKDLATLSAYPALGVLNPQVRPRLEGLLAQAKEAETTGLQLYAVPYSLAYAEELWQVYGLLLEAADEVAEETPDFASYLRLRARDLLSNDYEAGDASWISGSFGRLNAQIRKLREL